MPDAISQAQLAAGATARRCVEIAAVSCMYSGPVPAVSQSTRSNNVQQPLFEQHLVVEPPKPTPSKKARRKRAKKAKTGDSEKVPTTRPDSHTVRGRQPYRLYSSLYILPPSA
jgi:hypothetical protein